MEKGGLFILIRKSTFEQLSVKYVSVPLLHINPLLSRTNNSQSSRTMYWVSVVFFTHLGLCVDIFLTYPALCCSAGTMPPYLFTQLFTIKVVCYYYCCCCCFYNLQIVSSQNCVASTAPFSGWYFSQPQNHKQCWDRSTSFGSGRMHTSCYWEIYAYWANTIRQLICCLAVSLYQGNGKSTRRWFIYFCNTSGIAEIVVLSNWQTTQCGSRQDRDKGFGPGCVDLWLARLIVE